jgi:phenylpropionate dioxygenase-like ring-hydroxylating dioxygenase large terminal subunit
MTYLRNAWYAAGWASELSETVQFSRTLLNEPVLLFRKEDGSAAAIGNRCPHRFAPLDMGKRDGDRFACPYHGLVFDASGSCVLNPHGEGRIPPKAKVPAYPVIERDLLLWIWMGDPALADPALVPDFSFMSNPNGRVVNAGDSLKLPCHHELAVDNLMDLSHAVFLHESSLGTPDALKGRMEVIQEESVVSARISVPNCTPAGAAFPVAGPGKPVDHWLDMQWRPVGAMVLNTGATLPGRPREEGLEIIGLHVVTPETDNSTHYFFGGAIPPELAMAPDGKRLSQKEIFEAEDEPMLAAVQRMMGGADLWSLDPVLLPSDAGAVRVRRVLEGLIAAEQARRAAA